MKDHTRHFLVGLTTFTAVIFLMTLLLMFGKIPSLMTTSYQLTLTMNDATGLTPGSLVNLNGVSVGRVDTVQINPQSLAIEINCQINQKHDIPQAAHFTAKSHPISNAATIYITLPAKASITPSHPKDNTAHAIGTTENIARQISAFATGIETRLDSQLKNIEVTLKQITKMSDAYTTVGHQISTLIEQRPLNTTDTQPAKSNLYTLIARTDQRIEQFGQILDAVTQIVQDPSFKEKINSTLTHAHKAAEQTNQLTKKANTLIGSAQKSLQSVDKQVHQLTHQYIALASTMNATSQELKKLLAQAGNPQGTVGQLLKNPALYHNLLDTTQRLDAMLSEAQLLMMKWKAEGFNIQF